MFLQIGGTVWVQLLNFAIFFAILNVVFLRPVGRAIRQRREYIDGVKHDSDRYLHEARDLRAQAEEQRAAARRAGVERVTQARTAALAQADGLTQDFAARAATIAAEARATVEREVAAARGQEPALAESLGRSLLDRALEALAR
ncbi:MAG: hypothetical protein ABI346_07930 [Candidatus Baltobacteraceae bacterium]